MRTTVWILGDQLLEQHPALTATEAGQVGLRRLLVESQVRTARLPDQRKEMVFLFSAMHHYAVALQEQGYAVDIRNE